MKPFKFICVICSFVIFGYANTLEDLQIKTMEFFEDAKTGHYDIIEVRDFILELRLDLKKAGYKPPPIHTLLNEMEKDSIFKELSIRLKYLFPKDDYTFFEKIKRELVPIEQRIVPPVTSVACSKESFRNYVDQRCAKIEEDADGFDLGPLCVGGCEVLAGCLCYILPYPPAWGVGAILFGDAYKRIMENLSEKNEYMRERRGGRFYGG